VHEFSRRVFVMGVVRTRDREAARELVQDVLMAVIGALRKGQLQDADKLAAFVHGTARNLINNQLRSQSQRPPLEPLPEDLAQACSADQLEDAERMTGSRGDQEFRAGRPEHPADDLGGRPQAGRDRVRPWTHLGSGADAQAACPEKGRRSYEKEDVTNLNKLAT